MFTRLTTFLKEARQELKKVTWPSRQETINYTIMVVVISGVVAVFLGGAEYIFQFILNKFIL